MVDTRDLKSLAGNCVPVRVRSPAPRRSKLYIACSDLFYKSERTHAAAPPFPESEAVSSISPPAPRRSKLYIACSDLFYKSERARAAAPPFQIANTSLVCDLIFFRNSEAVSSIPPLVPKQYNPNQIFLVGDGFGLFVYFAKFEETHFKNGIIKRPNSKPRVPRKKKQ